MLSMLYLSYLDGWMNITKRIKLKLFKNLADQQELIYISCVRTQDVLRKTCWEWWMIGTVEETQWDSCCQCGLMMMMNTFIVLTVSVVVSIQINRRNYFWSIKISLVQGWSRKKKRRKKKKKRESWFLSYIWNLSKKYSYLRAHWPAFTTPEPWTSRSNFSSFFKASFVKNIKLFGSE